MQTTSSRAGRPAHIAMFSIAAHGHVRPSLEIVRELVRRGHRVTYAVPQALAGVVAETGAEPRVFPSTLPSPDADPEEWGTELVDQLEPFLDDAIQSLPHLAALYEGEGGGEDAGDVPDLVLADSASFASRVLAHRWGVRHLQLTAHMVGWDGYREEVAEPKFAELRRTERGRGYWRKWREWLDGNGIATDTVTFMGEPDRALVLIPKALQPHADRVDESVYTFVGPCLYAGEPGGEDAWQRPAGAGKVLLVSLGSAFTKEPDFYRECVKAFGDLPGWHVVLQIGRHVSAGELGPVPGNFEVRSWVPQLAVLREADLFVTHAGAGGSREGLLTGTPMIAVPQAADQPGNAAMLESLGVARHLPKEEADAAALRAALESLDGDPEVAARCAAIAEEIRAEGGTERAVEVIEGMLSREAR
ncbi:macrolide family glycosyltransferase [Streptomyces sp. ODS28]|uniref:macrolide family glycosyltransferase n=1 Tax=Streptomyces sp. ODS28 TaxID=3136688 RepID=UPI0031ECDB94